MLQEAETSRNVRVGEFDIHYHDAGDGPPLIMLHGSGPGASGWGNFHRNIDFFVDAGFRVILMDMPGFSKSSPVLIRETRDVHHSRVLAQFMETLGINRADIIGNSMGGGIALNFATWAPDRVGKLVLIGASGTGPSITTPMPTEGIKAVRKVYQDPTRDNLKELVDLFVYDPQSVTAELIDNRFRSLLANADHLRNFVESCQHTKWRVVSDMSSALPSLRNECLITWGREDRFMPLDMGLRLLTLLPNSQLHVFKQCGHWGQWEQASKFNRVVYQFLKD